jgi:hypothetical protein
MNWWFSWVVIWDSMNRVLSNGDLGINSDYYAYLEAIWTFKTQRR